MSENMRKRIALRHAQAIRKGRAVSPVVATLILILVAVAAAAALYLWLVAWQGGVTSGIGSPGAQYTVTIGGSTSVYPFAQTAAKWFDANQTDVQISVNSGGSGAGMAAVCSGQVDIGQASAFEAATTLETADGCPQTLSEQIVAYDGVDLITQTANTHGLLSMSFDTLQTVIAQSSSVAPSSGFNFGLGEAHGVTMDGALVSGFTAYVQPAQGTEFAWDQLPACAAAAAVCGATGAVAEAVVTGGIGAGVACVAPENTADQCATGLPALTGSSPCGFTVCAGGAAAVHIYYRSDVSGTTQSFLARLVAAGGTFGGTAVSLGFTGCSGDNQFDGCGGSYSATAATGENGNPGVILGVSGDANGLGYASDGLTQASGSGVTAVSFQGFGQTVVVSLAGESTALKAIAKGIADTRNGGATYGTDQAYIGWRPFMNVETTAPTGEVLRYLQFVMDPANNEAIAAQTAEISIYASGLAGVVPVTPISGYQETL